MLYGFNILSVRTNHNGLTFYHTLLQIFARCDLHYMFRATQFHHFRKVLVHILGGKFFIPLNRTPERDKESDRVHMLTFCSSNLGTVCQICT